MEENVDAVMTTVVSSIPSIQTCCSMLGTSSFQHCFFEENFSSIMATTVSMFTSSVDSVIHSYPSSFSSPQRITTSPVPYIFQDDIPSECMTLPSICDSFTSLALTSISCHMNIVPVSIDIPFNQTQSDPLVSIHQQSISSSEVIEYFGEDVVVSFGKYYWNKKYKVVVKRGAKRARQSSGINVPIISEVIWKADASDMQQGAVDTAVSMGVFAGANFQCVSQLSLDLGEKQKELEKVKHELA